MQVNAGEKRSPADVAADAVLASGAPDAPAAQGVPKRFVIVFLCFVAFMLCNMDRVNMSIAILPMQQEFGWTSQTVGIVQSSFFWCACIPLVTLVCVSCPA